MSITVFKIPLRSIRPSGEYPNYSWLSPSYESQILVSFMIMQKKFPAIKHTWCPASASLAELLDT